MKNTNNKYLLFGLVGLIVGGAVVVLTQNSGQLFQGALLPATTSYTTTTVTLDSVNRDLQALKAKVAGVEKTALATKSTVNTLIDGIKVQFMPGTCQGLIELNNSLPQPAWPNFTQTSCETLIGGGIPNKLL